MSARINIPVLLSSGERELFASNTSGMLPNIDACDYIVLHGIQLDLDEFLFLCIHTELGASPRFQKSRDLTQVLGSRRAFLEEYFRIDEGGYVRVTGDPPRYFAEQLGVGVALAVAKQVFKMNDVDFRRIPESSRHTTLDYSHWIEGCDGRIVSEIECKGVRDGAQLSRAVTSIHKKKHDPRRPMVFGRPGGYVGHTEVRRLGVIAEFLYSPECVLRAHLVDPPSHREVSDPEKRRFVMRILNYSQWLRALSRGTIVSALGNRLVDIMAIGDAYKRLDGMRLVDASGESLYVKDTFLRRIELADGSVAHGRVFDLRLSDGEKNYEAVLSKPQKLLFLGFDRRVLDWLCAPDSTAFEKLETSRARIALLGETESGILSRTDSGAVIGLLRDPTWDAIELKKLLA